MPQALVFGAGLPLQTSNGGASSAGADLRRSSSIDKPIPERLVPVPTLQRRPSRARRSHEGGVVRQGEQVNHCIRCCGRVRCCRVMPAQLLHLTGSVS